MDRLKKISKRPFPGWAGLAAIFVAACVSTNGVEANTLEESGTFGGMRVNYRVVLPDGYDPARAYPAILAFTGGSQNERAVNTHLERFWTEQAEQRGYIVVSPAAPTGRLYFQGGDGIFPEFLDQMLNTYNIEDGKFHVAGASNGGLRAFHIAASTSAVLQVDHGTARLYAPGEHGANCGPSKGCASTCMSGKTTPPGCAPWKARPNSSNETVSRFASRLIGDKDILLEACPGPERHVYSIRLKKQSRAVVDL